MAIPINAGPRIHGGRSHRIAAGVAAQRDRGAAHLAGWRARLAISWRSAPASAWVAAGPSGTVVGVVGDVRDYGPASRPAPTLFLAHGQWPVDSMSIVAKSRGEPSALIEPMRALLREMDPDVPMYAVRSMPQISRHRGCAAAALPGPDRLLRAHGHAAGGDRSVRRAGLRRGPTHARDRHSPRARRETRRGAAHGDVAGRQAGGRSASALGLVAAVLASRLLRAQLFEVAPTDTVTYVLVGDGTADGLAAGQLDSGATRVAHRSDDGASTGLIRAQGAQGAQAGNVHRRCSAHVLDTNVLPLRLVHCILA